MRSLEKLTAFIAMVHRFFVVSVGRQTTQQLYCHLHQMLCSADTARKCVALTTLVWEVRITIQLALSLGSEVLHQHGYGCLLGEARLAYSVLFCPNCTKHLTLAFDLASYYKVQLSQLGKWFHGSI
jgi:hypothetical protein